MGTEVVERNPQQDLIAFLHSGDARAQIEAALPAGLSIDRFQRATASAIIASPDLVKADRSSLFQAVVKCAMDGLLPDGREAAITTYSGKAQYLPMIGGYRKIAGDYGYQIAARVVYAADEFEHEEGLEPKLRHVPARPGVDRGERVAAYATARNVHTGIAVPPVVMYAADIAKRQGKAQTDRVWKQWTDRMWEKTVGKAIFKELPLGTLDPRVARLSAAETMDAADATALLYGPQDTPADPPADVPAVTAGDGQQAGDVDERELVDAPAPGNLDDALTRAEAAGRMVVPGGAWKDRTLAEIADHAGGVKFFQWMLGETQPRRSEGHKEHVLFLAAESVAAVKFPNLAGGDWA